MFEWVESLSKSAVLVWGPFERNGCAICVHTCLAVSKDHSLEGDLCYKPEEWTDKGHSVSFRIMYIIYSEKLVCHLSRCHAGGSVECGVASSSQTTPPWQGHPLSTRLSVHRWNQGQILQDVLQFSLLFYRTWPVEMFNYCIYIHIYCVSILVSVWYKHILTE